MAKVRAMSAQALFAEQLILIPSRVYRAPGGGCER